MVAQLERVLATRLPGCNGALEDRAEAVVTTGSLRLSHVFDTGVAYLLVRSAGPGHPLTLLLPTGLPSGLAVFSRLGRLHARHWAVVWGSSQPPATGVGFSSGDLRFRRGALSPAVIVGPVWAAIAEGAYREAILDPEGRSPRWLALAQSW